MRKILLCLVLLNVLLFSFQWLASENLLAGQMRDSLDVDITDYSTSDLALLSESAALEELITPATTDEQPMCVRIGPFRRLLQAEYFQESAAGRGIVSEITSMDSLISARYQVDLVNSSVIADEKSALAEIQALQGHGLNGFIEKDDNGGVQISLGVFDSRDEAEHALERAKNSGYEATITPRPHAENETWVTMVVHETGKLNKKEWLFLLALFPGIEKQPFLCLGVASH